MDTQTLTEPEFNVLQFEKQLTALKDSQDSINTQCQWCLQNRTHHKKIVNAWLNVLKRVKVEQRLTLFYLANDVVQYSKRRNYEYVESWGTALQKATTMVRDERVKHKILRIFKIWEQRGVYSEEFISDLCGLLSVVPSGPKGDEPHEFQPNYVINKIKTCAKLEKDTDSKLKVLKEHNPKIQIDTNDGLIASLKDRAHIDDVEKEVDVYVKHIEDYINALKLEIKNRITLITVLKQAETQLESDRKDVKVVANAYKMFGTRVKTFQKKLNEHKATLSSPIPSPDINAPSPSPDSDIELPEGDTSVIESLTRKEEIKADYNPKVELQFVNAGYYNPVGPPVTDSSSSFLSNGFSSFIGSEFNLESLNNSIFGNNSTTQTLSDTQSTNSYTTVSVPVVQNPPLPVEAPSVVPTGQTSNYSFNTGHLPLLPPPMPPFSKSESDYTNVSYNPSYTTNAGSTNYNDIFTSTATYSTATAEYNPTENTGIPTFLDESFEPPLGANPYPPSDEYNPEEDLSTWDPDVTWNGPQETDTPESPPLFEKEGYSDPVEYHDNIIQSGAVDVDHRVIPGLGGDLDDSLSSLGGKDVDHRNLISLTGSPGNSNSNNPADDSLWNQTDQDYRIVPSAQSSSGDQDYRLTGFNIEQLKLPPPPPPPPKVPEDMKKFLPTPAASEVSKTLPPPHPLTKSPRKNDNVESIDMDLSDEDVENKLQQKLNDNLKVIVDNSAEEQFSLEPPPPLPDLPDDVDANNFLDDLSNELHEFSNLSDELSDSNPALQDNMWNQPLIPPPMMNFNDMISPPMNPSMNPMNSPMNPNMNPMNSNMNPMNSPMNPMNSPMNHINSSMNHMNLPMTHPMNSMNPPMNHPMNHMIPPMNPPPLNPHINPPPSFPSQNPLNNIMNPPPMPPMLPHLHSNNWMSKDEPWMNEEERHPWLDENELEAQEVNENQNMNNSEWTPDRQNNWAGPQNFGFRGRGNNNRGNFNGGFNKPPRGRGRGGNFNRGGGFVAGGNMFRGGRGNPRGSRSRARGNFRGNFRGGF